MLFTPRVLFSICFIVYSIHCLGQKPTPAAPAKPKLVVGIVVDQMRWDFLERYKARYTANGFNRLLSQGFSFNNCQINYTPTYTACGHACIYTGTTPALNGITGNDFWDNEQQKLVYCTENPNTQCVGCTDEQDKAGKQSPANMWANTIGDELRLSNEKRSRVFGVAFKDRGAILPAGHLANAAFWFHRNSGNWITSKKYLENLPAYVNDFNNKRVVDSFMRLNWNTMYAIETYKQSTSDYKPYERSRFGKDSVFPYNVEQFINNDYEKIIFTPQGNDFTLAFAKKIIENEKLGKMTETDMLCISLSSPDYIGHSYGPNSIETEDTYLRLDKSIGDFLTYLDKQLGKNNYTVFLSADHGVSQIPAYLNEMGMPAQKVIEDSIKANLNAALLAQFGMENLVLDIVNYQVILKNTVAANKKDEIIDFIRQELLKLPWVINAVPTENMAEASIPEVLKEKLINGFNPKRSGVLQIITKPHVMDGKEHMGTTHGMWNNYDTHIPLLFYGNGISKGSSFREVHMEDIAPTLAALLKIQMPNSVNGKVLSEIVK
jgi:predicted AlkP superfamily pyrophosphatase or phosphodiesterase